MMLGTWKNCRLADDGQIKRPARSKTGAGRWFIITAVVVLLSGGMAALLPQSASAQQIVALVNGDPITALDITQRTRLIQVFERRQLSRQEALDELINEKIKLQQAKRYNIEISDKDVDRVFAGMAQRTGRSVTDFSALLKQSDIDLRIFKTKIRADIGWQQVMQQRIPGAFYVRDADVVAMLSSRGQQLNLKATQYTMRQFIFIIPRGSPDTVRAARMREAESLKSRFTNCEDGIALAREYRDVVIKNPVIRISTDLPERLQKLLENTNDGHMTPPESISTGIEVVAVCGRKETIADIGQREVKDRLSAERVRAEEKQLLELLRRQSIIENR